MTITGAVDGAAVEVRIVVLEFEHLYRAEYPSLLAVATALTGDFVEGEDLVQDTLVKAFVQWPRVRRLDRPGGWCHRVLTNACRSSWRRRRTRERWLARQRRVEAVWEPLSADVLAFWDVVRTMPQRPRTAVALFYGADRTTAEIAEILDVPHNTVRSDLLRARVVLARELGS